MTNIYILKQQQNKLLTWHIVNHLRFFKALAFTQNAYLYIEEEQVRTKIERKVLEERKVYMYLKTRYHGWGEGKRSNCEKEV